MAADAESDKEAPDRLWVTWTTNSGVSCCSTRETAEHAATDYATVPKAVVEYVRVDRADRAQIDAVVQETFLEETRSAMRRAARMARDASVTYVRSFGERVSNEDLATMIERMPLPGAGAGDAGEEE